MQIRIILKCCLTPSRLVMIKWQMIWVGEDMEKSEHSYIAGKNTKCALEKHLGSLALCSSSKG